MLDPVEHPDSQVTEVQVLLDDRQQPGRLTLTPVTTATGSQWRLDLNVGERSWSGCGHHVFAALRELLAALDVNGARIGVNGARPNAWASGMQADMGSGLSVYVLPAAHTPGRPPEARTLDPAPLTEVGALADQDRFQERWRSSIRHPPAPGY